METATPSSPPFAPPLTPARHRRLQARPSSLERSGVAAGSPSPLPRPPPFARKSKRFSKDIAPRGETRGQISGTSGTVSHRTRTVPPSSGASVRKICLQIFRCLSSLLLSLSLSLSLSLETFSRHPRDRYPFLYARLRSAIYAEQIAGIWLRAI
jgi:hypothetical protein